MNVGNPYEGFIQALLTLPALTARPERHVYIPPGFVLLMDVIDQLGKEMFPAGHELGEWTGKELLARSSEALQKTEPTGPLFYWETVPAKPPSTGRAYTPSYVVPTVPGPRTIKTQAEADELWRNEGPAVVALRAEERRARRRCDATTKALRDRLATGDVDAFILDTTDGRPYPVVKEAWATPGAGDVFNLGDRKELWAKPNHATMSCRTGSFLTTNRTGHVVVRAGALSTGPITAEIAHGRSGAGSSPTEVVASLPRGSVTGLPGRPPLSGPLIAAEMKRRIQAGEPLEETISAQAETLVGWLKLAHPDCTPLKNGKVVQNLIRDDFNDEKLKRTLAAQAAERK